MKLATFKSDSPDGELFVVSSDLNVAASAKDIVLNMQSALDNWRYHVADLVQLYQDLNNGLVSGIQLDKFSCDCPLPRVSPSIAAEDNSISWLGLNSHYSIAELVHRPVLYNAADDVFLSPYDAIDVQHAGSGVDFGAQVAIITGDVPMRVTAQSASDYVRLVMLGNGVSFHDSIPLAMSKKTGQVNSNRSVAFSPVAVTPDELGLAWSDQQIHLPLCSFINGELFGQANAGLDLIFNFSELIALASESFPIRAGTIFSSGVATREYHEQGSSCLSEIRQLEKNKFGKMKTPLLGVGDQVIIEMYDHQGQSIFGAINQTIRPYQQNADGLN
jgi:fumarylacetoacetate (FAA) hydrolase